MALAVAMVSLYVSYLASRFVSSVSPGPLLAPQCSPARASHLRRMGEAAMWTAGCRPAPELAQRSYRMLGPRRNRGRA